MKFNITDTLYALSYALDCVEHDLTGASTGHSKRVAYISIRMGQALGLDYEHLSDLAACAILHDCALTEYVHKEFQGSFTDASLNLRNFKQHCIYGEEKTGMVPFYYPEEAKNAILYHHEAVNGKGFFGKTTNETPLYARLIHLAHDLDMNFHMNQIKAADLTRIDSFLNENTDSLYDSRVISCFRKSFLPEQFSLLQDDQINASLHEILPSNEQEISPDQLISFMGMFASITDFKSKVTRSHCSDIAGWAHKMALFYGTDEETAARLYTAGALHDIGKLTIDIDILEKPDKLTDWEYKHMQRHAYQTFAILKDIPDMDDITRWASYHHEKLDGSGYPFHLTSAELDQWSRLIACLDIYQALIEDRPFKEGMSHAKACGILQAMAGADQLDSHIIQDISQVLNDSDTDKPYAPSSENPYADPFRNTL